MENIEQVKKNIASNITKLRKSRNLTQAELAEELNYSDKSISKWERGEGFPDIFTLKELAEFFDVNVDDFYSDKPIVKKKKVILKKKVLIPMLSIALEWLIITILFMLAVILFRKTIPNSWLIFIYGVPISGIIFLIFMAIYHHKLMVLIGESIIIWGVGTSAYLTLLFAFSVKSLWLIFPICAVLEILAVLYYILKNDKIKFKNIFHKKNEHND